MTFGVLADLHGNFEAMQQAMERHPDVPFWLCVGDVASRAGEYPTPPVALHWIKGNNENFDRIDELVRGTLAIPNLHHIPNGHLVRVGPLTVAALGGTFAPTWYDTPAADLPHPGQTSVVSGARVRDDKRRHFVHEEVEACKQMSGVDVFLTHEAPRPFIVVDESGDTRNRRREVGKRPINEVLAALRPRLHLCGHHHRFTESVREGVRSVCVDRVSRSYLLVDAATLTYRKVDLQQAA